MLRRIPTPALVLTAAGLALSHCGSSDESNSSSGTIAQDQNEDPDRPSSIDPAVRLVGSDDGGADTVGDLIAQLQASSRDDQFGELVSLILPADRDQQAFGIVLVAQAYETMKGVFGGLAEQNDSVAEGFGLDDQEDPTVLENIGPGMGEVAARQSAFPRIAEILDAHGIDADRRESLSMKLMQSGNVRELRVAARHLFDDTGTDSARLLTDLLAATVDAGMFPKFTDEASAPETEEDRGAVLIGERKVEYVQADNGRWYVTLPPGR